MKKLFIIPLLLMPLALPAAGKSAPGTEIDTSINRPQGQTVSAEVVEDLVKRGDEYWGRGFRYYSKAVEWYRKAAALGDARAQCKLGYCYKEGLGVSEDYSKAVEWYSKAAAQGNVIAQYNLGCCYYEGNGVPRDLDKAVEWYSKAGEELYPRAWFKLESIPYTEFMNRDYNRHSAGK